MSRFTVFIWILLNTLFLVAVIAGIHFSKTSQPWVSSLAWAVSFLLVAALSKFFFDKR